MSRLLEQGLELRSKLRGVSQLRARGLAFDHKSGGVENLTRYRRFSYHFDPSTRKVYVTIPESNKTVQVDRSLTECKLLAYARFARGFSENELFRLMEYADRFGIFRKFVYRRGRRGYYHNQINILLEKEDLGILGGIGGIPSALHLLSKHKKISFSKVEGAYLYNEESRQREIAEDEDNLYYHHKPDYLRRLLNLMCKLGLVNRKKSSADRLGAGRPIYVYSLTHDGVSLSKLCSLLLDIYSPKLLREFLFSYKYRSIFKYQGYQVFDLLKYSLDIHILRYLIDYRLIDRPSCTVLWIPKIIGILEKLSSEGPDTYEAFLRDLQTLWEKCMIEYYIRYPPWLEGGSIKPFGKRTLTGRRKYRLPKWVGLAKELFDLAVYHGGYKWEDIVAMKGPGDKELLYFKSTRRAVKRCPVCNSVVFNKKYVERVYCRGDIDNTHDEVLVHDNTKFLERKRRYVERQKFVEWAYKQRWDLRRELPRWTPARG